MAYTCDCMIPFSRQTPLGHISCAWLAPMLNNIKSSSPRFNTPIVSVMNLTDKNNHNRSLFCMQITRMISNKWLFHCCFLWRLYGPQITATRVWISAWAYLKVVSSWTSPHYLWRLLGPFSLTCAQKWQWNINHQPINTIVFCNWSWCTVVIKAYGVQA